jgi:hypothetical protein
MKIRPDHGDGRILQPLLDAHNQIGQALGQPVLRRIEGVEIASRTDVFRHGGLHRLREPQAAVGHRSREFLQGVADLSTPVIECEAFVLGAECQGLVHQVVGHAADGGRLAAYDLGKADHSTSPVCTARTIAAGSASILPPSCTTCSLRDSERTINALSSPANRWRRAA